MEEQILRSRNRYRPLFEIALLLLVAALLLAWEKYQEVADLYESPVPECPVGRVEIPDPLYAEYIYDSAERDTSFRYKQQIEGIESQLKAYRRAHPQK